MMMIAWIVDEHHHRTFRVWHFTGCDRCFRVMVIKDLALKKKKTVVIDVIGKSARLQKISPLYLKINSKRRFSVITPWSFWRFASAKQKPKPNLLRTVDPYDARTKKIDLFGVNIFRLSIHHDTLIRQLLESSDEILRQYYRCLFRISCHTILEYNETSSFHTYGALNPKISSIYSLILTHFWLYCIAMGKRRGF